MFNRYNKKTTTTSNRLTIVHASDIENERGKIERKMGREKNEEQKKKRIELNVIRMNSQYIKKKRRKLMIDRMCVGLLHYTFFKCIEGEEEEEKKMTFC